MSSVPEAPVMAVRCTVLGAKGLGDQLSEGDICARFIGRIGLGAHLADEVSDSRFTDRGLLINISVQRAGVAAAVAVYRDGSVQRLLPTLERSAMDRALTIADLDLLAADVAAELASSPQP